MSEFSGYSIGDLITNKINGLAKARRSIELAESLNSFNYEVTDIHSAKNITFFEREPHANQLFNIGIIPQSEQYYSFLKRLQLLGFDVYAMLSNPKEGEMASPIHGDISLLNQKLHESYVEKNTSRTGFVRNKMRLGGYFKEGRFHMRIYPGVETNTTSITAHIDPPDFSNHANILNHLRNKVATDYKKGEELFNLVLKNIGGLVVAQLIESNEDQVDIT